MASYYANTGERARLIAGFRALADFLQDHPDVPAPHWADVMVFPPDATDEKMRAEIDQIAAGIGADPIDRTAAGASSRYYPLRRHVPSRRGNRHHRDHHRRHPPRRPRQDTHRHSPDPCRSRRTPDARRRRAARQCRFRRTSGEVSGKCTASGPMKTRATAAAARSARHGKSRCLKCRDRSHWYRRKASGLLTLSIGDAVSRVW